MSIRKEIDKFNERLENAENLEQVIGNNNRHGGSKRFKGIAKQVWECKT